MGGTQRSSPNRDCAPKQKLSKKQSQSGLPKQKHSRPDGAPACAYIAQPEHRAPKQSPRGLLQQKQTWPPLALTHTARLLPVRHGHPASVRVPDGVRMISPAADGVSSSPRPGCFTIFSGPRPAGWRVQRYSHHPARLSPELVPPALQRSWESYRITELVGHLPIPRVSSGEFQLCPKALHIFPRLAVVPWPVRSSLELSVKHLRNALQLVIRQIEDEVSSTSAKEDSVFVPLRLQRLSSAYPAVVVHKLPSDLQRNVRSFVDDWFEGSTSTNCYE